jgi:hypothetical protein
MQFRVYDRVKVKSDIFIPAGVQPGAVGWLCEDFEDGSFEMEVWDEKEVPYARVVVTAEHIELVKRF